MSHRFKRPKPVTEQGRASAEVRKLARLIPDQSTLDRMMADCQPGMRHAFYQTVQPYLSFKATGAPYSADPAQSL